MQHVEVIVFIDQSFSMEPVIVLSGSNILRENDFIGESLLSIFACIPVVLAFKCHYLFYSLPIHSLEVFVVKVFIEFLVGFLILFLPRLKVQLKSEALLRNLFPEITLIVEMLRFHFLGVFL